MQPCSRDESVYVGTLGLPEGLHARLLPTPPPPGDYNDKHVSWGTGSRKRTRCTGALHWSRSMGGGAAKSATTQKNVHVNMFSVTGDESVVTSDHRVNKRCLFASEQVEISGYGDVTEQSPLLTAVYVFTKSTDVLRQMMHKSTCSTQSFHPFIKTLHWWPLEQIQSLKHPVH